jgi:hypothetical protein
MSGSARLNAAPFAYLSNTRAALFPFLDKALRATPPHRRFTPRLDPPAPAEQSQSLSLDCILMI